MIADQVALAVRERLGTIDNHPLRDPNGFVIDEAEVTFWGLCRTCQTKSKSNEKESAR